MSFLKNNNIYLFILVSFFILYFITRILFLESDLPPWNISYYQSIDELYYTIGAFNLYHYGDYDIKLIDYISEPKYVVNYFMEIFVAMSLKIFGNNYFGLRMASVLSGAIILLFIYLILKESFQDNKNNRIVAILILLYLILDFSFLISNRVAEPTIFRLSICMVVYYLVLRISKNGISYIKSFIFGLMAFLSVFLVYTTNFFIIPTIGLFIILSLLFSDYKKILFNILFYILGLITAGIIFLVFYWYAFNNNFIIDFITLHSVVTDRISNVFLNIFSIFNTNIFRFNTSLLLISLVSLPLFVFITFYKKDKSTFLLFSTILMFFLQTVFINDYPQRKLFFILPFILIMIYIVYDNRKVLFEKLLFNKKIDILLKIYILISFLICIYFTHKSLDDLIILNYFVLVVVFVNILIFISNIKYVSKYIIWMVVILFFITNIILDYKYVFSNPEYKYKNSMIEASQIIDNSYTVGWSHAMRLYNKSIPLMSAYWYKWWSSESYENHKLSLLNEKGNIYEFILINDKNSDDIRLFKVFDINEVTGDKIGLIKYNKEK